MRKLELKEQLDVVVDKILEYRPDKERKKRVRKENRSSDKSGTQKCR